MKNKTCSSCNESKPVETNFYRGVGYKDGYRNQCIDCRRTAEKNYERTDAYKKVLLKKHYRKLVVEPEKLFARNKLQSAVQYGTVPKPTKCSDCGRSPGRIEGHHYDYSKPLDVTWLCSRCHHKVHNHLVKIGEE